MSVAFVTYFDEGTAHMIYRSTMERLLAACPNIFAIGSIYRWEGDVVNNSEFVSLLKILSKDFQAVAEVVKQQHQYDVPCIVRYDVAEGSEDYLSWFIASTVRPP